jgi:AAA domain-containing protein
VNYDRAAAHLWLVKDMIQQQGAGLLSGQWGTAKTFTAIDLSGAVLTGTSFAGREVIRRGGVLFIAAEGAGEVAIRLQGIVDSKLKQNMPSRHDIDLDHLPFAWIEDVPDLKDVASYKRLVTSAVAIAAKVKADFGIELALIIFDTLSASVNFKDANDAAEGQAVMNKLQALSKATGAFVLAVDHFGKDASAGTRGTSTKEASADVILALLADRDLAGNLSKTRMAVRKVRGGKPGDLFPFDLEVVQLECGDSTCVIRWKPEQKADATAVSARPNWPRGLRVFRTSMQTAILDHGQPLRPYGIGATVQAVSKRQVKTEFTLAYPLAADDADDPRAQKAAKRTAFNRAMKDARDRGLVGSREVDGADLLWFTDQNEGANGAN